MWLIGWDFRIARVIRCTYRELWICILLYSIDGMSSTFMYKGEYDENLWIYAAESWIAQHQPIILKLFSLSLSVFFFVFFFICHSRLNGCKFSFTINQFVNYVNIFVCDRLFMPVFCSYSGIFMFFLSLWIDLCVYAWMFGELLFYWCAYITMNVTNIFQQVCKAIKLDIVECTTPTVMPNRPMFWINIKCS